MSRPTRNISPPTTGFQSPSDSHLSLSFPPPLLLRPTPKAAAAAFSRFPSGDRFKNFLKSCGWFFFCFYGEQYGKCGGVAPATKSKKSRNGDITCCCHCLGCSCLFPSLQSEVFLSFFLSILSTLQLLLHATCASPLFCGSSPSPYLNRSGEQQMGNHPSSPSSSSPLFPRISIATISLSRKTERAGGVEGRKKEKWIRAQETEEKVALLF